MSNLSIASQQWFARPDDQRYLNIPDMRAQAELDKKWSRIGDYELSDVEWRVVDDSNDKGLFLANKTSGKGMVLNDSAFAQLTDMAKAPKGFLGELPASIASQALNHKFKTLGNQKSKFLMTSNGKKDEAQVITLRASLPTTYGVTWNADILSAVESRFGDGITGDFRVPGEFGKEVIVDKQNTTLYLGGRSTFVFLADEKNRIEIPNRRDGKSGSLARGFYILNSETGWEGLKFGKFLFDYACKNRTIWGAEGVSEITLKHTASINDRWLDQIAAPLNEYINGKASVEERILTHAMGMRIGDTVDDRMDFIAKHFGTTKIAKLIDKAHAEDEGRSIETIWDVSVGATAFARNIPNADERSIIERKAGKVLDLAAKAIA